MLNIITGLHNVRYINAPPPDSCQSDRKVCVTECIVLHTRLQASKLYPAKSVSPAKSRMGSPPLVCHAVLFFSFIVCVGGTCTWADQDKTIGEQSKNRGDLGAPFATLDECKARCEAQAGCVAIDSSITCSWFSVKPSTSAAAGTTHSVRTCTAATTTDSTTTSTVTATTTDSTTTSTVTATTTNPTTTSTITAAECTMTENEDTRVTSTAQVTVDVSSSVDCQTLCKDIPQCRAYSYTSGTCDIHTSDDTTTSINANYEHATKINCIGNGEPCCFSQVQTATKLTAGTTHSLTPTLDSCKSMCLAVSSCQGLTFSGSTCYLYASIPSTATQSGSVYYPKTCGDGADTGSLTISVCGSAAVPQLSKVLVAWILAVTLLNT